MVLKNPSINLTNQTTGQSPNPEKQSNFIQRIKKKIWEGRRKKIQTISFGFGLIILMILGITIYQRYFTSNPTPSTDQANFSVVPKIKPKPTIKKYANPLSGTLYPKNLANRHPLAVVVENHPDARPQSGLDKAEIIYEAIAEGGITRFLAIFGPRDADEIGPVRSARTFSATWVEEYNAYFAHAGGSKDGRAQIATDKILNLNHTRGYFERHPRPGIAVEHTLYTSTKNLYQLAEKKGYPSQSNFTSFNFKDDAKLNDRGDQEKITIPFSTHSYQVDWLYDKEQNLYKRIMAGKAHQDKKSGEQLTAKNIIIQTVSRTYRTFPQDPTAKGVWFFHLIGSGKAKVIRDGKTIEATWRKSSIKERTKFYDSNGDEIKFNRGIFWYEVIPPEVNVKITTRQPATESNPSSS